MPLPDLQALCRSLPLVTATRGERFRVRLGDVLAGDGTPVIIAGPCAVESLSQLLQTARRVKEAGGHGLRGGAFKPRSSPYSFQGLGPAGLEMLATAKIETGLFLTVEVVDPHEVDLVADYADLLQIGARNMQNFALLRATGRGRRPVLLKRGLSSTIQEWLQAAEYILAEGNPNVILCERGIRTFEPLTRNTFDLAAVPLAQSLTGLPVFADPSHATGRRELVAPMARASIAAGADGLLIEVHPEPEQALSDGEQSLTPGEFDLLMQEIASAGRARNRLAAGPRVLEIKPSLTDLEDIALGGFRYLPVHCTVSNDELTPIGVWRHLAGHGPAFLLESVESGGNGIGRYSFYGDRPLVTVTADAEGVKVKGVCAAEPASPDVLSVLARVLAELNVAPPAGLPPRFHGGAIGYLGYDYVHRLEPVARGITDPLDTPESWWMVPERLVIVDHVTRITTVVILAPATREGYEEAVSLLAHTAAELRASLADDAPPPAMLHGSIRSSLTEEAYCRAVERAKEAVIDGDIFQVVLSQRLTAPYHGDALGLYRTLRNENPSPYLFLLDCGPFQLVGSSPETLVRLEDGTAEVRPLAGTRPRGRDGLEDRALEAELRADAKECAEHVMLVDLGRNDLGRVCRYGTIKVPELMAVERFSRVMHLVSRVTGEPAPGEDAFSLLRATFPAGTLTGAPKVRAMQIIAELEPFQRGIYGGAVGYVGFNGNLDTCIAIRTVVLHDGQASIQAGAGIVADSDPAREYAETMQKASALLTALDRAKGGVS